MLERMDDFFNSRLDGYEEHQLHAIEQAETFYPITASHLPETPHARVLDLGCGTGLELGYYFDRNPTACVTGIDLAGDMLNALHSKFPDKFLTLVQGSYFTVPFGECCYDAVVSVESLHHFTQAEKIPLYQKVLRALIPGGCLILTDYFAESDEQEAFLRSELLRLKAEQGIQDEEFYHYDTPLTVPHEMEALQIAGFPHVEELGRWGATHLLRAEKPAPSPNATHPIDLKSAPDAHENSDRIKMIRKE